MTDDKRLDKHMNHSIRIVPRYHKGKPHLIPGLYCEDCVKLIKWLKPKHANELVEMGVPIDKPHQNDLDKLRKQKRWITPEELGI